MKLFVVVIALAITTESFAQGFGIKAGLNLSNMLSEDDEFVYSDYYDNKAGFHLGVTAEFPVSEMFSFETGLLFTQKGLKITNIWGMKVDVSLNLNYLEVPLLGKVTYDLGGASIYGQLGPYVGFGLSGKWKSEDEEEDVEWGSDEMKDDFKRLDFGLNIGAGAQISNITIGATYGLGLANISPDDYRGYRENHRVIAISIGYKF